MKRRITILGVFVMGLSLVLNGQSRYSFSFEVMPNLSWATTNTNYVSSEGAIMGVKYGLRGSKYFKENYAFTTGLIMSHTGFKLKYTDSLELKTVDDKYMVDSGLTVRYHTQYIEIPVGMKFQSKEIGYFRILFEAGFLPGVRLRAKTSVDKMDIHKDELKKGINLFSLSYYFDAGISYSLGSNVSFRGSLCWTSGLFDVTSDKGKKNDRVTLNQLGLKLGIIF